MQYEEFLKRVREKGGLADDEQARQATDVVLKTLGARITHESVHDITEQLPKELKEGWEPGMWDHIRARFGGAERMDLGGFFAKVVQEMGRGDIRQAESATRAVFMTLQEQLTGGAVHNIEAQLPEDIRGFWIESRSERAETAPVQEGPPFEMEAPVAGGAGVPADITAEEEEGARPWGPESDVPTSAEFEPEGQPAGHTHGEGVEYCEACGRMIGETEVEEYAGVERPAEERIETRPPEPVHPVEGPGSPEHYRSDPEIEKEVRELLASAEHIDASKVNVFVQAGNVTLRGAVGTPEEREAAGHTAARALAVGEIFNELSVEEHH